MVGSVCRRLLQLFQMILTSWLFMSLCNPLPLAMGGPSDLFLMNKYGKSEWVPLLRFKKRLSFLFCLQTFSLPLTFLTCTLWWSKLLCWAGFMVRNWGWSLTDSQWNRVLQSNNQWGTESCQHPQEWVWQWIFTQSSYKLKAALFVTLMAALSGTWARELN